MTKLAYLIARQEGFFKTGSLPQRNRNPGDLRHSPHSIHVPGNPDGIGIIDTDADGWADLERQLQLYAERGMTLRQCLEAYAPPSENDTTNYIEFVSDGLGVPLDTPMVDVLKIEA